MNTDATTLHKIWQMESNRTFKNSSKVGFIAGTQGQQSSVLHHMKTSKEEIKS